MRPLTAVLLVSLNAGALLAQAPPNDFFTNSIPLTGTNTTDQGSNINATKEPGEPDHAGNVGGQSVWWTWTAPTNGDLIITTDGSSFDTLLGIYTGTSVSALSLVASNDDHGVLGTSRVRFHALASTQYQIAVDGYNDGYFIYSGDVALALSFISDPVVRPPNDNFTNRIVLQGLPVTANGTNVNATREPGEPLHAGEMGDASVWWSWTAPSNGAVRITTDGSTFDTLLAVYTGDSLSNLTEVASDDDEDPAAGILTSEVAFNTAAGQTYQIAVDGYDGDWGQITLNLTSATTQLTAPRFQPDGSFQFTVNGLAGGVYEIDLSTNSLTWSSIGTLTNTSGISTFVDGTATNSGRRFYRAVLQ
jgi:hypothetical protein